VTAGQTSLLSQLENQERSPEAVVQVQMLYSPLNKTCISCTSNVVLYKQKVYTSSSDFSSLQKKSKTLKIAIKDEHLGESWCQFSTDVALSGRGKQRTRSGKSLNGVRLALDKKLLEDVVQQQQKALL